MIPPTTLEEEQNMDQTSRCEATLVSTHKEPYRATQTRIGENDMRGALKEGDGGCEYVCT